MGKFFKHFNDLTEYEYFKEGGAYAKPNISLVGEPPQYIRTDQKLFGEIKHFLRIVGPKRVTATSCSYVALYDNTTDVTSASTWSFEVSTSAAMFTRNSGIVTIDSGTTDTNLVIGARYGDVLIVSGATSNDTLTFQA